MYNISTLNHDIQQCKLSRRAVYGLPFQPKALQQVALKQRVSCKPQKIIRLNAYIQGGNTSQVTVSTEDDQDGTVSYNQALFNSVNILLGVGILSIPYTMKEGGWASLGVLAVLWLCTNYTGKILIRCQEAPLQPPLAEPETTSALSTHIHLANTPPALLSSPQSSLLSSSLTYQYFTQSPMSNDKSKILDSYEAIGGAAFGNVGRNFITAVLYTELIGTCALFLILEGDHLMLLLKSLAPHAHLPTKSALMVASAALFIPTTWLPDLSGLSYVGILGALSALGIAAVLGYHFVDQGALIARSTEAVHLDHLPLTFGLAAFVFAGHAVFPTIYKSMKQKDQFERMLDTTYWIVGAVCVAVGVTGYAMYGSKTLQEVTLNLPPGTLRLIATSLLLISPMTKFALTLEPVAQGIDNQFQISKQGPKGGAARLARTGLGVGALILATSVPFFAYVMAVIGSFLTLTVSVIFPSLCYLRLYNGRIGWAELMGNYVVLAVGGLCTVSGTYISVKDLIEQVGHNVT